MLNPGMFDRMLSKSAERFLYVELCTQYALPPVAAEALMSRISRYVQEIGEDTRSQGQIVVPAVSASEPAGKPIKNCKLVNVTVTLNAPEDAEVFNTDGAVALREHRVLRMVMEAHMQGGLLTQEDLARILAVDISTVKRMFARLRKRGAYLASRGMVKDIGPATSHKVEAVRYYAQNYDLYDIGLKLGNHGLDSIARYIKHFALTAILVDHDASLQQISRILRISENLVCQYVGLYNELNTPENARVLDRIKGAYSLPDLETQKGGTPT